MNASARNSMIVTFKLKDKRRDKRRDKVEIICDALETPVRFFDSASVVEGTVPRDLPAEVIGFDINEYEVPALVVSLTAGEVEALKKNPNVARVEEDGVCHAYGDPGPLMFEGVPVLQAETVPAGISQVNAPSAWEVTRGKGIKVAVLDTGIDFNHPDLAINYRGGASFVRDESSPMDYNRHGTHCAGTVAAEWNGIGVVGVAPTAYLYAVKVLSRTGSGAWSNVIAGLDWCVRNGIHIASMSLGANAAPRVLEDMCNLAYNRGVLLVAAAGNEGGAVGVPARYRSVVAVSAVDASGSLATFSNRGPEVELCAPGVNVLSTLPGGRWGYLSGTSMACPHVSGAAALAWSSHRFPPAGLRQNESVRRLLVATADLLGPPGRDERFGFGRVNAERAAFELNPPGPIPGLA